MGAALSDGVVSWSLPSGEIEPSVMLAWAPSDPNPPTDTTLQ
jgi:hypothetical protein